MFLLKKNFIKLTLTMLIVTFSTNVSMAQESIDDSENIAIAKKAMEQWVETQKILSQEKKDFAIAKDMLQSRMELYQSEIENTIARIDEAMASIGKADEKRQEIMEQSRQLKEASQSLEPVIATMEEKTRNLVKRLPDHIREHVKVLSQRIPANSDDTKLSLSERFQNVIGIANEVDKFNAEISMHTSIRQLDNGSSVEVTTVYIGIGQAYYVNTGGDVAGYGMATDDSWLWVQQDAIAPAVSKIISILRSEQMAEYVQLPVEIK